MKRKASAKRSIARVLLIVIMAALLATGVFAGTGASENDYTYVLVHSSSSGGDCAANPTLAYYDATTITGATISCYGANNTRIGYNFSTGVKYAKATKSVSGTIYSNGHSSIQANGYYYTGANCLVFN